MYTFVQVHQISGSMNCSTRVQRSGFMMPVDLFEARLCGSAVEMLRPVHQTNYPFESQAYETQITCILQDHIMQPWSTAYEGFFSDYKC